jgi:ATP-dependent helicase HrpB
MILSDPGLEGVAAVIFDEFHERALSADLGLALALETQSALRPDLRIVLMSATLDTDRLAARLDATTLVSEGRAFPVTTHYLGRDRDERVEDAMARAIVRALRETDGSILAFLPGQAEILRTTERLAAMDLPHHGDALAITPLYGALPPAEQDRAVRPPSPGTRKIVLATDIAESALTLEGVSVVIDAGLARVPEVDAASGISRLVTRRATRANLDQRRGRAGRTAPGVCYRLFEEADLRGLPPAPEPEILGADLTGLVLDLAGFGEADPMRLTWIDPPPAGRLRAAQSLLREIGALSPAGALTPLGASLASLPLPPRLGLLIALASSPQEAALGAQLAVLLTERGSGGPGTDALERLKRLRRAEGRDRAALDLARRWSPDKVDKGDKVTAAEPTPAALATLLLRAWPQRLARARDRAAQPGAYLLASGEAARLDPHDPLARSEWLIVLELTGVAKEARIQTALAVPEPLALSRVETAEIAGFSPETATLWARRVRRIGAITLSETPLPPPKGPAASAALAAALRTHGPSLLPGHDAIAETLARLRLLREAGLASDAPDPSEADLTEGLIRAVADSGQSRLDAFDTARVRAALMALLHWPVPRELDQHAPLHWEAPTGTRHRIDHTGEHAPRVSLRVQEVYGQATHPSLCEGRVPLTLELLSPAHRPIALTRDLPGFWRGGYTDMRKDMRGRYPKHDWPETPWDTPPHLGKVRRKG